MTFGAFGELRLRREMSDDASAPDPKDAGYCYVCGDQMEPRRGHCVSYDCPMLVDPPGKPATTRPAEPVDRAELEALRAETADLFRQVHELFSVAHERANDFSKRLDALERGRHWLTRAWGLLWQAGIIVAALALADIAVGAL